MSTNLAGIFTLPFTLSWLLGTGAPSAVVIAPGPLLRSLLRTILAPLLAGVAARAAVPGASPGVLLGVRVCGHRRLQCMHGLDALRSSAYTMEDGFGPHKLQARLLACPASAPCNQLLRATRAPLLVGGADVAERHHC